MPSRRLPVAIVVALLAVRTPPPARGAPGAEAEPVAGPAVRVMLETVVVDARGTRTLAIDEADLFAGASGTLRKTATLEAPRPGPSEIVTLSLRVTLAGADDASCRLALRSTAAPSGAGRIPESRTTEVEVPQGEQRLVEVYASPVSRARLALKVGCASPPDDADEARRPVAFALTASRSEAGGPLEPLKSAVVQAAPGSEAESAIAVNVPLPPDDAGAKRYRRERVSITVAPSLISGDQVQVRLIVAGEIATISETAASIRHPVDLDETLVLKAGSSRAIDLEVRAGPSEGWSVVLLRVEILPRFTPIP